MFGVKMEVKEINNEVNLKLTLDEIFDQKYTKDKREKVIEIVIEALKKTEIQKELFQAIELDEDISIEGFSFITNQYSAFKTLQGNRQLNATNLKKLNESITTHGYRSSQPITINELAEVLNGQHRMEICKEKQIPIIFNYERTHNDSLELTVDMNISQKNWELLDYIKSYADRGYEDYINFLNLIEEQGITPSLALWLIYHSRNGNVQERVRTGSLSCSSRDMVIVKNAISKIKELRDVIPNNLPNEKALRNAFLGDKVAVPLAVIMDQRNYKHSRMSNQISKMYQSIDKRNMSVCGDSLVAIYNYRLKDPKSRLIPYEEMEE